MFLGRAACVLLFILAAQLLFLCPCQSTPLDDYVHAPDPHFAWSVIRTFEQFDNTLYILNFTSQKWFDETFSTRPIWWHYLCVSIPKRLIRPRSAFMFIDGGSNTNDPPKPNDEYVSLMSLFSVSSGSIGVTLHDIPNQPVRFMADRTNQSRGEDAIIAWTWKTFLENPSNPYVLLRMPMTKAAVRAMDAVQQFAARLPISIPETFFVAGASKRGWTTWTTAAVDNQRVFAAAPIVMDMLNLQANLHHHYRSLAGWTFEFNDYYMLNITEQLDSSNMAKMGRIIDPFSYFDRYSKTKILQIQTTGDEFFLPDNENLFWKELQLATGGSFLRRIPNAEHMLDGHKISLFATMESFYLSIYDNRPLPSFQWTKITNSTHGYIRATVDFSVGPSPMSAIGNCARTLNDKRRDFRLYIGDPNNPDQGVVNPVLWLNCPLVIEEETPTSIVYSLTIANPSNGWEAFFIQVNFPGSAGTALELTTETLIIPDTYPTDDCHGEQCLGTLV